MEYNTSNITAIIDYINTELKNGRTMASIEREEFGVNERVIHKRLSRLGYKKINNQYQLQEHITSNTTPKITSVEPKEEVLNTTRNITPVSTINTIESPISGINNIDKLNLLLDNIDLLLKLIPAHTTSNTTALRSSKNVVTSLRIDSGIYEAVKQRAVKDNITIADIVNKALEDYLNNYL